MYENEPSLTTEITGHPQMHYKGGYKYVLDRDFLCNIGLILDHTIGTEYTSLRDGMLTIRKGFAWDGPSGPTIDTDNFMRGALVHDALYSMMRQGVLDRRYRRYADDVLKQYCVQDGMWRARYHLVYWAVRRFAGKHVTAEARKEVKTAP